MNNFTKTILVAVGFAAAIPFVNAADATTAPATNGTTTTAPAGHHAKTHAMMHRRAMQRHLAKKLNLSTDQVAQFKSIRSNTRTTVSAIRANTSLTPEQKKAQVKDALKAARAQRLALLTPDQQAKLNQIKAHFRQRLENNL